ncbi:hypothetical protein FRC05_002442 [Tulasnella sp. 425]|nr:hypothetical protein FRC05_002442 [Tulasnella sp. 425]
MATTRDKRVNYAPVEGSDQDIELGIQGTQDEEPHARRPALGETTEERPNADPQGKRVPPFSIVLWTSLDIFAELCLEFTPLDFLQLARSTRRLREILMSRDPSQFGKGLAPTWKIFQIALKTALNYSTRRSCSRSDVRAATRELARLITSFEIWLCNACLDTRLTTQKNMYKIWRNMPWEASEHIPHSWYGNKKLYLISVFNTARDELLGEDGKIKKELQTRIGERLKKFSQMMYDLHKLILSDEREHKVIEKLIEKGWERDDMSMMSVEWDTPVYKPVPLTDQRASDGTNYDLYSDYIAGRLIQDQSLSQGHFLLALYDEDEPHYTAEKWDKHLEAVRQAKALGLLKVVVEKGTGAGVVIKKEERSVEPEEGQAGPSTSKSTSPAASNDLSSLNAITTIFKCTVCHDRLWYPDVLQQTCCRGKVNLSLAHYFEGYDDDGLEDAFHFYAMARVWVHVPAARPAESVVVGAV